MLRRSRTLTPEEFDQLIQAIPEWYRLMVETAIETGMRWGELSRCSRREDHFEGTRLKEYLEPRAPAYPTNSTTVSQSLE